MTMQSKVGQHKQSHTALGLDTKLSVARQVSQFKRLGLPRQRPHALHRVNVQSRVTETVTAPSSLTFPEVELRKDLNQVYREGHTESSLVQQQAGKKDDGQPSITSVLPPLGTDVVSDVIVVGCGPAGLYLAAQLANQGLKVGLIGRDAPFVNNYGVWVDEFSALGFADTLECSWPDAVCFFGEGKQVNVGRVYGRVHRRKLRAHLLNLCKKAGVAYLSAEVVSLNTTPDDRLSLIACSNGTVHRSRLVTLAAGAAGGKFLKFEQGSPSVAAQTAYGIEAEVEGYDEAYPKDLMLFMDYRRHHTGMWEGQAKKIKDALLCSALLQNCDPVSLWGSDEPVDQMHPGGPTGLWGSDNEVPSFLYAMPLGGKRVFLEETCLVARPPMPFAVLKRRLERRCQAMGLKIKEIHEEEWSYIPIGGPLPTPDQPFTGFGAAANLVHPATGFSLSRSLREAPGLAEGIAAALRNEQPVAQVASEVWDVLWPMERRRQGAFNVFGMELLCGLDLAGINNFFLTFFSLPQPMWRGFLASKLSSIDLMGFAALTFILAPWSIKFRLMSHLASDTSAQYLLRAYTAKDTREAAGEASPSQLPSPQAASLLLAASQLKDAVDISSPPM